MLNNSSLILGFLLFASTASAQTLTCGNIERAKDGIHESEPFPTFTYKVNGGTAVIVRQDMRVNADGARSAYELNNHGISYLCDGLTARDGNKWVTTKPCDSLTAEAIEQAQIKDGKLHFSDQGPELCIFGFHVEGGRKKVKGCSGTVVGKGHPSATAQLTTVAAPDGSLHYLISATSLANRNVDVTQRYIDSEKIPFFVIPGRWHHENIRLGDYAYVYSPNALGIKDETLSGPRGSFAVAADTGPRNKFGEGSIALHQMLVFGELRKPPLYQKVAGNNRHPEQSAIFHPYQDRRDGDIRAKSNIDKELWHILFAESANKSIQEHSFGISDDGAPNGNVYTEGKKAAALLGGTEHIIACLKKSSYFE
jgi:hypothetical protein